ncbi:MAG: hypothetical protein QNK27_14220 [Desulfuromusa sp.]|nr:hypothetical protein [Desulfuromusa sp.]
MFHLLSGEYPIIEQGCEEVRQEGRLYEQRINQKTFINVLKRSYPIAVANEHKGSKCYGTLARVLARRILGFSDLHDDLHAGHSDRRVVPGAKLLGPGF